MPLYNCAGGNGGGGGGTSDYSQLSNKPQINNTTLIGNKSASDLGLVEAVTGKGLSTNDYTNTDKAIVDGVTSALAGKADVSSVPTKTSDLTNDSGFITNTVNNLVNYYLKTETYSKTEVDALLQAITTLDIQAVSQLPTTNISTTTIYLVPKQDPQVPDVKDEYINLDGTTSGWELIGNTQIDLSNYVTTSDLTTALQSYATKAYVDGLIGDLSALTTTDKSSVVAAINELNNAIVVSRVTASSAIEVPTTNITQFTIPATKSGYKPIGIVGWGASSGNSNIFIVEVHIDGSDNVNGYLRNVGSSQASVSGLRFDVLYAKDV